jgi:hypothetical protein
VSEPEERGRPSLFRHWYVVIGAIYSPVLLIIGGESSFTLIKTYLPPHRRIFLVIRQSTGNSYQPALSLTWQTRGKHWKTNAWVYNRCSMPHIHRCRTINFEVLYASSSFPCLQNPDVQIPHPYPKSLVNTSASEATDVYSWI